MSWLGAEKLLTAKEAASHLNVSIKTIRRRIDTGEIAVVRIGRSVRIHPKELQRYMTMNWDLVSSCPSKPH